MTRDLSPDLTVEHVSTCDPGDECAVPAPGRILPVPILCLFTGSTWNNDHHRNYRVQANRFEYSESMGSNAHLRRLQPGRRRLLYDLLLPFPSAFAQASQIRRPVSVRASTFRLLHFFQTLSYTTLSAIKFSLASACMFSLPSPSPNSHPPPPTSLPLYPHLPRHAIPSRIRVLPCIATLSSLPFKPRHPYPGHSRRLAQTMCMFVWLRLTHSIRRLPRTGLSAYAASQAPNIRARCARPLSSIAI